MHDSGNHILRLLFVLVWVLAGVHVSAEYYHWYWTYRWLDIPMHLFGGVWLGVGVLWLRRHTDFLPALWQYLPRHNFTMALLGGVCIGLVWEVYEYSVWQYTGLGLPPNYLADTQLDVLMDTLGAMFGYVIYRMLAQQKNSPVSV